jgi:hypothetical protein
MEEVLEWQNRPLEPMYPVVFFDALRVKIRDEGSVKNKAVSTGSKASLKPSAQFFPTPKFRPVSCT